MRIRTHTNPFKYYKKMSKVSWRTIFPQYNGFLDLEIGVGRGVFLREIARTSPQKCFVGVDVRKNIISELAIRIEREKLENIHLIHANGYNVLEDMIPRNSLENLYIFHPDPWFKPRHHKRRIVSSQLLALAKKKLTKSGRVYLSTDVKELWEEMSGLMQEHGFRKTRDIRFWNTYTTHWKMFSEKDKRKEFYGVFRL